LGYLGPQLLEGQWLQHSRLEPPWPGHLELPLPEVRWLPEVQLGPADSQLEWWSRPVHLEPQLLEGQWLQHSRLEPLWPGHLELPLPEVRRLPEVQLGPADSQLEWWSQPVHLEPQLLEGQWLQHSQREPPWSGHLEPPPPEEPQLWL